MWLGSTYAGLRPSWQNDRLSADRTDRGRGDDRLLVHRVGRGRSRSEFVRPTVCRSQGEFRLDRSHLGGTDRVETDRNQKPSDRESFKK